MEQEAAGAPLDPPQALCPHTGLPGGLCSPAGLFPCTVLRSPPRPRSVGWQVPEGRVGRAAPPLARQTVPGSGPWAVGSTCAQQALAGLALRAPSRAPSTSPSPAFRRWRSAHSSGGLLPLPLVLLLPPARGLLSGKTLGRGRAPSDGWSPRPEQRLPAAGSAGLVAERGLPRAPSCARVRLMAGPGYVAM